MGDRIAGASDRSVAASLARIGGAPVIMRGLP
jgi:hypothetical protein